MTPARPLRVVGRPDPVLTVGDLLDQEDLALELLAGGEAARGRRVAGAHSIELEQPSSWLGPDWIMLTAGVRLRGSTRAQRELIAELHEAGAAALGFGYELVFRRPPPALLEEADRRGFPVIGVPLRTAFREIVTATNRALLSSDLRTFQRLSSMQLYLLDALREDEPRAAVAERVAQLLHAGVAVLSTSGAVVLTVGDVPAAAVWQRIEGRPTALHEVDVEGRQAIAAPVLGPADEPLEWLVVAPGRPSPLAKPVAQAAAPLLAATARLGEAERSQERAIRGALLDELLRPGRAGDAPVLAARAASAGVDLAQGVRVAILTGCPDLRGDLGIPHLVTRRGEDLVVLARASAADLRARLEVVLEERPGVTAGYGREVADVPGLQHSLRDAELAVQRVRLGAGERLLGHEDFELALLLLSEAPPDRVGPRIDEWTALLRARPMLWEAVVAYFELDLDVSRTAAALHLHPNSLRYRLARVEKLLGRSLKQPSTIAAIYIAMLAGTDNGSVANAPSRTPPTT
jgi:purine catabolism regulator